MACKRLLILVGGILCEVGTMQGREEEEQGRHALAHPGISFVYMLGA